MLIYVAMWNKEVMFQMSWSNLINWRFWLPGGSNENPSSEIQIRKPGNKNECKTSKQGKRKNEILQRVAFSVRV